MLNHDQLVGLDLGAPSNAAERDRDLLLGPLQRAESYKHGYFRLLLPIGRYEGGQIDLAALFEEVAAAQRIVLIGDPAQAEPKASALAASAEPDAALRAP